MTLFNPASAPERSSPDAHLWRNPLKISENSFVSLLMRKEYGESPIGRRAAPTEAMIWATPPKARDDAMKPAISLSAGRSYLYRKASGSGSTYSLLSYRS